MEIHYCICSCTFASPLESYLEKASMGSSTPAAPPYPSAARLSDSSCYAEYTASLKCLEEFASEKSRCQEHFDIYKECKKKEREARLERNRSRSLFS